MTCSRLLGAAILGLAWVGAWMPVQAHAAPDWPQFRGPTGDGQSTAKNVPTRWSPTENVAWKVSVPGRGWSSTGCGMR